MPALRWTLFSSVSKFPLLEFPNGCKSTRLFGQNSTAQFWPIFPESAEVSSSGVRTTALGRERMWNRWALALPDGVADDHVALEEEEEDCAEFRQNIVSIGPGQLGYSDDGKMVIFIEMMVILVITTMIMMTYWLQSPDRSTLPPKAPLPQHPPELQWIAMWLSGWRRWSYWWLQWQWTLPQHPPEIQWDFNRDGKDDEDYGIFRC